MTCRGQKISKKKTSVKYSTSSPVFNEAMTFDVPQHIVEEVSLIVNVFHHSRCVPSLLKVCFHYGCAALRVAIDIETPIVFLYLLSFTIAHYPAQCSAAVVETAFNTKYTNRDKLTIYEAPPTY